MKDIINFIDQLRAEKESEKPEEKDKSWRFGMVAKIEIIGKGIEIKSEFPIYIKAPSRGDAVRIAMGLEPKLSESYIPERMRTLVEYLGDMAEVTDIYIKLYQRSEKATYDETMDITVNDDLRKFTLDNITALVKFIRDKAISNKADVEMSILNSSRLYTGSRCYGELVLTENDGYKTKVYVNIDRK